MRAVVAAVAVVALGALAAVGTAGCSRGSGVRSATSASQTRATTASSGAGSRFGPCQPLPQPGAPPAWFPDDLPLPAGSYAVGEIAGAPATFHKGVWAANASLRDFVRHVALGQWEARGWRLGRGDAEAGEAEDDFHRGKAAGTFRARAVYCNTAWTELVVTFTAEAP